MASLTTCLLVVMQPNHAIKSPIRSPLSAGQIHWQQRAPDPVLVFGVGLRRSNHIVTILATAGCTLVATTARISVDATARADQGGRTARRKHNHNQREQGASTGQAHRPAPSQGGIQHLSQLWMINTDVVSLCVYTKPRKVKAGEAVGAVPAATSSVVAKGTTSAWLHHRLGTSVSLRRVMEA